MRIRDSGDFGDSPLKSVVDFIHMKAVRFLPLTFVAGIHGFALFAPYVGLVIAAALFLRHRRQQVAA